MEDVWKDISLSTLNQDMPSSPNTSLHQGQQKKIPTSNNATTSTSFRGMILQDFLAGSFKDSSTNPNRHSHTALTLSPGQVRMNFNSNDMPNGSHAPSGLALSNTKKHALEQQLCEAFSTGNDNGTDNRKKRLMKNRESAARSRARKQAYTNELEHEVAHLHKENRKLKKQYNELRKVMNVQAPVVTKATLQRTLTAPF